VILAALGVQKGLKQKAKQQTPWNKSHDGFLSACCFTRILAG